jgi:hypothetical protein
MPFSGKIRREKQHIAQLMALLLKKNANGKIIQISSCHLRITPYNAPPLTRNNGKQAAGSAGFLRKF